MKNFEFTPSVEGLIKEAGTANPARSGSTSQPSPSYKTSGPIKANPSRKGNTIHAGKAKPNYAPISRARPNVSNSRGPSRPPLARKFGSITKSSAYSPGRERAVANRPQPKAKAKVTPRSGTENRIGNAQTGASYSPSPKLSNSQLRSGKITRNGAPNVRHNSIGAIAARGAVRGKTKSNFRVDQNPGVRQGSPEAPAQQQARVAKEPSNFERASSSFGKMREGNRGGYEDMASALAARKAFGRDKSSQGYVGAQNAINRAYRHSNTGSGSGGGYKTHVAKNTPKQQLAQSAAKPVGRTPTRSKTNLPDRAQQGSTRYQKKNPGIFDNRQKAKPNVGQGGIAGLPNSMQSRKGNNFRSISNRPSGLGFMSSQSSSGRGSFASPPKGSSGLAGKLFNKNKPFGGQTPGSFSNNNSSVINRYG